MLTTYNGGKNQAGVWQRIISLMPPHDRYVELFLGSGAILRRKRPAAVNVGIDKDPRVIEHFNGPLLFTADAAFQFACDDAIRWLTFNTDELGPGTLLYADPPYLRSTRTDQRQLYRAEFSDADHERLLSILTTTAANVIISGYTSPLYESCLSSWQRHTWRVIKRSGRPAMEVVWFNYPEPTQLHDYRFLGRDYHDRTRIWRKIKRLTHKLHCLPVLERNAILSQILTPQPTGATDPATSTSTLGAGTIAPLNASAGQRSSVLQSTSTLASGQLVGVLNSFRPRHRSIDSAASSEPDCRSDCRR